jgi:Asp-tRNA(Asn)/Glu-tRNA(Gln) amidotransferase A subunit family amidase
MAGAHVAHYAKHRREYGADTRLNLALARALKGYDYVHAQRLRARIWRHFEAALSRCDALITPATARTAPTIDAAALASGESNLIVTDQIMRFAPAANLTGLPAIAFPAGYDGAGLPVGLQAMGRPWSEALLLRLALVAEGVVERRAPKVHHRLLG